MISKLFFPQIIKNNIYHLKIGYQHLIIIEDKIYIDQIIIDKNIEKLFLSFPNIFFFKTFKEMEQDLEILIDKTNDDYIVIIG